MVNLTSASSILTIGSIPEFPIIPVEFVLAFYQSDLDVDLFMNIPLGMVVGVNRG